MTSVLSRSLIAAMLALALFLGGCEKSKVTDENYAQLKMGMTLNQVQNILGSSGDDETPPAGMSISGGGIGTQTAAPEKIYTWKSKNIKIIVTVKDGKVVQLAKNPI
jgi:hypothetical protein